MVWVHFYQKEVVTGFEIVAERDSQLNFVVTCRFDTSENGSYHFEHSDQQVAGREWPCSM